MRPPKLTGSTRTIWLMALTAVISLVAGLGLSRMIVSPAEAAANAAPPVAGPITVPVEQRTLANDVVLRGDAIYEDPVDVLLETGDIGGAAIVTGQVPEVGATIDAGEVLLEITGRPVIILTGELPVYRTLRAGVSGPDVVQLKEALAALGIDAGDPASDAYDAAAAAGVAELYATVGYPAPSAGEEAQAAVDGARDMVRAAEEQVAAAQRELASAAAGAPLSERTRLQGEVDSAAYRLTAAEKACEKPTEMTPCDPGMVIDARTALAVAKAARTEGLAAPDTSAARESVSAAQRALTAAREDLTVAQRDVLTPVPASEIVYLTATPRRVDSVGVSRGSTVAGTSVVSVSGATLQIAGNVSNGDADLIEVGSPVSITLPDGETAEGTVESVGAPVEDTGGGGDGMDGEAPATSDANRTRVVVVPGELTEDQRMMLQGSNVRMTIPVSSTEGEVMAVPTAALTAGPGGESRVEVLPDGGESVLVEVETGLAAGGFVEVTPVGGASLSVGDRVVIGITGADRTGDEGTEDTEDGSEGGDADEADAS